MNDAPAAQTLLSVEPETRSLYWSIRRELWENRSIYVVPLITIAVILFGFLIGTFRLPHRVRTLSALTVAKQYEVIAMPYNVAAGMTVVVGFVVGFFYCLDALYGERRDRSILFWKWLPVSDRTAVLAKVAIPLVVMPLISFVIIVTAQLFMLMLSTGILVVSGVSAVPLWTRLPLVQLTLALVYALIAIALWHAPIYGWLLLISAWARRATFLWAALPPFGIGMFEKMAFGTKHFADFIGYRVGGWFWESFNVNAPGKDAGNPLTALTPGKFLSTPALWLGLAFAAAFIAAAIRLRRNREPI